MKTVSEKEFDEIIKSGLTLVDFYADWCGPCKMLGPIIEELDNEYPDITFIKVDCDINIALCDRYDIFSIPVVILFKDGEVLEKSIGYHGKEDMKKFIERNIK